MSSGKAGMTKALNRKFASYRRRKMNGWIVSTRKLWKDAIGVGDSVVGRRVWVYSFEYGVIEGRLYTINEREISIDAYGKSIYTLPWRMVVEFGSVEPV